MRLEMSLRERGAIKLPEETGCSGGMRQSPFWKSPREIQAWISPGRLRKMNQTCQDVGRGERRPTGSFFFQTEQANDFTKPSIPQRLLVQP